MLTGKSRLLPATSYFKTVYRSRIRRQRLVNEVIGLSSELLAVLLNLSLPLQLKEEPGPLSEDFDQFVFS